MSEVDTGGRGYRGGRTGENLPGARPERKGDKPSLETDGEPKEEKRRSWLNIITSGAQLTLDIIRVIKGTTDFYRKLKVSP